MASATDIGEGRLNPSHNVIRPDPVLAGTINEHSLSGHFVEYVAYATISGESHMDPSTMGFG